ncbi:alpha/beta hydrolase [Cupriavidus gilardii]|uniref:Alpha/beta hydrolase n=1 Tax=Cupriavidus gilardii TaxID=82541 RepID=A0A849BAM2_9BURK|nr:alpha/beta hydrolase [Cupriavidus gilardii]KAB0596081.1 alpha/beta hydrolase [Cupriavidus gilardii]MCT9013993.1 alpha/beta hydrolase [Cupriavidus gilardii]MCT9052181.1 alpha/beta hydrolase [Cupriavidus gilardii]NNH10923.1 alpha/beta hydrolase [Cupriavidus gilardii]WNG70515.1 alpha/beta hydrolase [Cupriavidus gilardii]
MAIDPDLLAYYRGLAERFAGAPVPVDAAQRRARFREVAALSYRPDPDGLSVSELPIALAGRTLSARQFRPAAVDKPRLLVYFHGGGWVVGSHDTHHGVAAALALDTGCAVVSVDYRLAPEHPYPAPCDDALDALRWLAQRRDALDVDPGFLAVAGDSAGGHLAAQAAALANADTPGLVRAQLLIYPVTAPRFASESYRAFASGPGLTRDEMAWYWAQFIGEARLADGSAIDDPRLHLMAPPPGGSRPVPPSTVVLVAAHDVLRDDGLAYADHLVREGAAVITIEASGMTHGFARLQGESPRAREWMRRGAQAFAQLLDEQ